MAAIASVIDVADRSVVARSSKCNRSASSAATIQSARDVPAAVTRWATVDTRPSRLVVVPLFSANIDAGRTTSARSAEAVRNESRATTTPARSRAWAASAASGKSASGSAPRRTRRSISPAAAAARMPAASRPPGRGRSPSCSAPTTLPRRSAGSTARSGCTAATASYTARNVAAADSVDSARFARPAMMTTGPLRNWSTTSGSDSAAVAAAAPPDSTRDRSPRQRRQPRGQRRQLDQSGLLAHDAVAQAQVENRKLLFDVGTEEDHRGGAAWCCRSSPSAGRGARPAVHRRAARRGARCRWHRRVWAQAKASSLVPRAPPSRAMRLDLAAVDRRAQGLGDGGESDRPRRLGEPRLLAAHERCWRPARRS